MNVEAGLAAILDSFISNLDTSSGSSPSIKC